MSDLDPTIEVVELLKGLRLPHMRRCAPDLLATAKAQRWEPAEAVRALLVEELTGRQRSSITSRRKTAGFPTGKTFEAWDDAVSSIPGPTQRSLRTLEWIDRHVSWFSLEALGALMRRHRADDTTSRAIRRIMRAELIVIDDIGLLPVSAETAEALYRVVDAAYERRSLAISSNLHPSGFDELMPKTIANSTVDRVMHHAHLVLTSGDSIRLTDATSGKGVKPLN
jgi:DNA replication protein DnaC